MATNREVILSGSVELSSGTRVPVRVILDCPELAREEEHELENVRIPLHDLTPIRVPAEKPPRVPTTLGTDRELKNARIQRHDRALIRVDDGAVPAEKPPRAPTMLGTWETAHPGQKWPYGDRPPRWPDDYPEDCNCNPPAHSTEQIHGDDSFHSRTCPEHPTGAMRRALRA